MRRLLPNHGEIVIRSPTPCLFGPTRIRHELIGVQKDVSTGERLPVTFEASYPLDRHVDPRERIAGPAAKIGKFEMERQVPVADQVAQPSRIAHLTLPFATDEDRRALRPYDAGPPHPICGTAP